MRPKHAIATRLSWIPANFPNAGQHKTWPKGVICCFWISKHGLAVWPLKMCSKALLRVKSDFASSNLLTKKHFWLRTHLNHFSWLFWLLTFRMMVSSSPLHIVCSCLAALPSKLCTTTEWSYEQDIKHAPSPTHVNPPAAKAKMPEHVIPKNTQKLLCKRCALLHYKILKLC